MVQYYILIKRKGAKKWTGAIPAKKGVSISNLRTNVRKQIKKGFTYRIITQTQLNKFVSTILKKGKKR